MANVIVLTPEELATVVEQAVERVLARHEPSAPTPSRLLSRKEALAYLRISETTLWRLRRTGKLIGRQVGRKQYFTQEELDAWLQGDGP